MKETPRSERVYEDCPKFKHCSCNCCPLDHMAEVHGGPRVALPGEQRCLAKRKARQDIAVAHGMPPSWGNKPRETANDRRREAWEALPDEEKARRTANLKPFPKRVPAEPAPSLDVTDDAAPVEEDVPR